MNDKDPSCELSIVLPCLNEEETLGICIQKANAFLSRYNIDGEVIVSDNGSEDRSIEIAESLGACVVHAPVRGYGAALREGILASRGQYVIMGDADNSYDFSDLMLFVEKLREGYDLVMGNRFKGGIKPGAMPFLHQYIGNPVLSGLGKLFFKSTANDFHCGLRGFSRESILKLDLRTTGMEFASEMVVKATIHSLRIIEVPTILYPDGRSRPPHLRTWSDGWRHLRFLLLYSPSWLFLYPGIFMILVGLAFSIWLLPGPRHIGSIVLDINTLLFSAMAVEIGFQSIIFSAFSKMFGVNEQLLPPDPWLKRLLSILNLEKGILLGLILMVIGIISSVAAFEYWQSQAFGPISPSTSLRLVIPGVTLCTLGLQLILSSFFLSLLSITHR